MVWSVVLLYGLVVSILPAADFRHCATINRLHPPLPTYTVACYWGEQPALGEPLPRPGLQL